MRCAILYMKLVRSDQFMGGYSHFYCGTILLIMYNVTSIHKALIFELILVYVAVPGRNRRLFRCVFQSTYRVWSALAQNFRLGWGSYTLCEHGKYSWVYPALMSSALNRSSALECFECGNAMEIRNGIMFDFYLGLPRMYSQNWCNQESCIHSFLFLHIPLLGRRVWSGFSFTEQQLQEGARHAKNPPGRLQVHVLCYSCHDSAVAHRVLHDEQGDL